MPDPTEPSQPPPPPPSPEPEPSGASTSTGLPSNVAAAIACIPLIGGIIFYILEKRDSFVRFYAMQSIIFGCAWFLFNIVWRNPGYRWYPRIFLGSHRGARASGVSGDHDHYYRKSVHGRPVGYPVRRADCAQTGGRFRTVVLRSGRSGSPNRLEFVRRICRLQAIEVNRPCLRPVRATLLQPRLESAHGRAAW